MAVQDVVATSGPSSTYPQRAYRNPTDELVKFLDSKHATNWAIWEFRAEGTGYPDEEVYNRIWHYPWPDHHPPPFALIPHIMASMRNWLKGGKERVVVVHCKAGKGRSGTAACSYLISEEGWSKEKALQRFSERRMRPGFGAGVSIPSQLRWVNYVDRWAQHGKLYVEHQVEIMEIHLWGLRDGVKVAIEGYVDEGRVIKTFHVFSRNERQTVKEGKGASSFADLVSDLMGYNNSEKSSNSQSKSLSRQGTGISGNSSDNGAANSPSTSSPTASTGPFSDTDNGGDAIFRPSNRVVLPSNDINIDFERRNKATYGWTMVTAVAHVWFNAFFEGNGPENGGKPADSGVFEIDWDSMDGIKGSSRKGTRAFDKLAVVWKLVDPDDRSKTAVIREPGEGEEVKQTQAADWKGANDESPGIGKDLGLRAENPSSANISRANSIKNGTSTSNGEQDEDIASVRPNVPSEEQVASASQGSSHSSVTGSSPGQSSNLGTNGEIDRPKMTQSPESISHDEPSLAGKVTGAKHVLTGDLPDGKPQEELKTAKEHSIGHLKRTKDTSTSS
ncbi:MAG: hypothetical protein M1819_004682 [Sarea resinae]|nr:MAG: hypothetical protein M1819_004682 [Sarea resinae]